MRIQVQGWFEFKMTASGFGISTVRLAIPGISVIGTNMDQQMIGMDQDWLRVGTCLARSWLRIHYHRLKSPNFEAPEDKATKKILANPSIRSVL